MAEKKAESHTENIVGKYENVLAVFQQIALDFLHFSNI